MRSIILYWLSIYSPFNRCLQQIKLSSTNLLQVSTFTVPLNCRETLMEECKMTTKKSNPAGNPQARFGKILSGVFLRKTRSKFSEVKIFKATPPSMNVLLVSSWPPSKRHLPPEPINDLGMYYCQHTFLLKWKLVVCHNRQNF